MSSQNQPSIQTLINGISGGLSPGQTYDLIRRIAQDLDEVFTTLFDGPLPAVSGINLTEISEAALGGNVAFTDRINTFQLDQIFEGNIFVSTALQGIFVTDDSAAANGRLLWSSTSVALRFGTGGNIVFQDDTGATVGRFANAGPFEVGVPANTTGAGLGDIVLPNDNSIFGSDFAGGAAFSLIRLNVDDLVELGNDAAASGDGHVAIPDVAAGALPAAAATRNGIIVIDTTNNKLCYYANGARYALTGVAF